MIDLEQILERGLHQPEARWTMGSFGSLAEFHHVDDEAPLQTHNHVLPKPLRAGSPHSANASIPEGRMPCPGFHPENPVLGRLGEEKDFNREAFDAFQTLLQAWGPDDYLAAKSACWPGLRQWRRLHGGGDLLDRCRAVFDASTVTDDTDDDNKRH